MRMKKRLLITILVLIPIFSLIAAPNPGPREGRSEPSGNFPGNADNGKNPPPERGPWPGDKRPPENRSENGRGKNPGENGNTNNSVKNSVNAKNQDYGNYHDYLHSQNTITDKKNIQKEKVIFGLERNNLPLPENHEVTEDDSNSSGKKSNTDNLSGFQNDIINYRGNRKVVSNSAISLTSYSFNNTEERIEIELNFNQSVNPKSITKDNILIDGEKITQKCKISFNKNSDSVKIFIDGKSLADVKEIEMLNVASIDGGKINSFIFESAIN